MNQFDVADKIKQKRILGIAYFENSIRFFVRLGFRPQNSKLIPSSENKLANVKNQSKYWNTAFWVTEFERKI